MRTILCTVLLAILTPSSAVSPIATVAHRVPVPRPSVALTTLQGLNWNYSLPFPVRNKEIIEKLISCESQGINQMREAPSGTINWGILQFNGTSTWQEMELRFNLRGSPMIPADAIRMADAMISGGFLRRWTCAHLLDLIKED